MSWRRLRTLIRREVLATFRDPFTMTILVTVPLVALLLFGFILATDVDDLALGVHDADGSTASRELLADLTAQHTFVARAYATRESLERALVAGDASVAIVIPPGFGRELGQGPGDGRPELQVIYDGVEVVLAGNADAFVRGLVTASAARLAAGDLSAGARAKSGREAARLEVVTRAAFNPGLDGKPFMVAGTFGFVLSFLTTLITAVSIVNERLSGTFDQLQVTPATSIEIFLGKILPMGAVFAFDVVLMALVAGFVLGVWPEGSLVVFVGISAFYVLISLSLGLIFSATSATAAEAVQKTILFSVPLVQLSGFVFPLRSFPGPVAWLAELFPATHYIRVSRAIYLRDAGPWALLPDLVALLFFGALLIRIALRSIEARA